MLPRRTPECLPHDYLGNGEDIGDLPFWREDGAVCSVWRLSTEERDAIVEGHDIELRIFNEPIPPVSLNIYYEKENSDANMPSVRSGDDRSAADRQRRDGGGGSPRVEVDRAGPLPSDGLVDESADGVSGESNLAGGQLGGAQEDLSGAEVALGDIVRVLDGQGVGTIGKVVDLSKTTFGHEHVTVQTDPGDHQVTTLKEKVAKL